MSEDFIIIMTIAIAIFIYKITKLIINKNKSRK